MKPIIKINCTHLLRILPILSLLVVLITPYQLKASDERVINTSNATAGNSFWVYDAKYNDMLLNPTTWQTGYTNKKVTNIIRLAPVANLSADFEVKVNVTILSKKWNISTSSFVSSSITTDLQVKSSISGTFIVNDKQAVILQNAHAMNVTVNSVNFLSGSTATSNLTLTSEIITERQYFISSAMVTGLGHFPSLPAVILTASELDLAWDYMPGAEWYELEYVHVSRLGPEIKLLNPSEISYNYYLNSTRVEVKGNHYVIPKVYDQGYVIYRVRAIGFNGATYSSRFESDWTAAESGNLDTHPAANMILIDNDYDPLMNWSFSASFAEEGKRSEGIEYQDGMGRGRQSVISNPATRQVVVNNTYYDEMGRPAIMDLPTPIDQTTLNHRPNFNRADNGSNTSFQYTVFDSSAVGCEVIPNRFSKNYGAGKYYSTNNPDKDGANAGIPDAEGFPYNRVTYKNDLLNRVDKQGAAGSTLKTYGGKEIRYMDLTSDQLELNMLFGSDIGWAEHYQKTAIIDQNGQVMIQYTDMAGRTVATYLMGSAPASLDALPENVPTEDTVPIITNGNGNPGTGLSSTSTCTKLITYSGNYTFNYNFTPQEYAKVCGENSICLDCVYDFNLKIVDECGTVFFDHTETISGDSLNAECEPGNFSMTPISAYLFGEQTGISGVVYTITKSLTVNTDAIDDYWCYYLDASCIDAPAIFNDLYADATFTDCIPNVDNSLESGPCDAYKTMMLHDMSPGGQYAEYTVSGGSYTYPDPLSILNTATAGDKYNSVTYLDHLGTPITVQNNAGVFVSPAALLPAEFIQKFQPEWALSLLQLHPEYCFYQSCMEANSAASIAFEEAMLNTSSFTAALDSGYFNAVPAISITSVNSNLFNSASSSADPYFSTNSAIAAGMNSLMADYIVIDGVHYSMWDYAIILGMPCSDANFSTCLTNTNMQNNCSLDYIWTEFRRMYLEAKKNLMNENTNKKCPDNCKIGVSGDYASKVRVWPCWSELSANNPTPSTSEWQTEIDSLCTETCTDYANEWLAKLSGCNISPADTAAIRQDLIDLCKSGCSVNNPQGFSTDINGNGINSILAAYGITETDLCSELLIADPGPYQTTEEVQAETWKPLDVCGCNAVMKAREDLETYLATNPSPAHFTTVEQMLAHNTGIHIEETDPLLCACDLVKNNKDYVWSETNNDTQFALNQYGYHIPPALSCDGGDCPDCAMVQAAITTLENRFSGITLSDSPNYVSIVTNYLNGVYHKEYTYFQYLEFFSKCEATTENPYCTPNPATPELLNMLTLLAYRGQLTSTSPIDLLTNNAVYQFGQIRNALPAPGTADYKYEVIGTTIKLTFDPQGEKCDILIDNTIGIDFSSVLSFDQLVNDSISCGETPAYHLMLTYLDCGQQKTAMLPISSSCFNFYDCTCSGDGVTLCNLSEPIPSEYCYTQTLSQLYHSTMNTYDAAVAAAYTQFVQEYTTKCALAFSTENLSYIGYQNNYQYTLFYYDQAGNLVKTVAPEWINQLPENQNDNVNYAREFGNTSILAPPVRPTQPVKTAYKYNSYNQVISTSNPDQQDSTVFYYDYYGRMVASQNAEQAYLKQYSYILYDTQGRPVESGQMNRTVPPISGGSGYTVGALSDINQLKVDDLGAAFKNWVYSGTRSEVTITTYDKPLSGAIALKFKSGTQQNLRLRVATVAYFEKVPNPRPVDFFYNGYTSAVHYSYDIHGNVIEQLQDVPELVPVQQDVKSTQYDFELISGNVNTVNYQAGEADQFVHTYNYDVINRLTEVHTSPDTYTSSREAHYLYYDYGPLARKELGDLKVQAEDYTYTINGWQKAKNATQLNPLYDAGKDGRKGYEAINSGGHLTIPADITGYTLGYFEGDYKPIGGLSIETATAGSAFGNSAANLYNGNIRLSTTAIQNIQETSTPGVYTHEVIGASYRYDQLNRLKSMTAYFDAGVDAGIAKSWGATAATNAYSSAYTYDRNGNLKTLNRYANSASSIMDQLGYNYTPNTNKLHKVTDAAGPAAFDDISNNQVNNNYVYNQLGQLTQDVTEGITLMDWRKGDKKLRQMTRNTNVTSFLYDPFGRRIAKINKPGGTADKTQWSYSYYANDANGATMAVYSIRYSNNNVFLEEQHIYGAGRLGMVQQQKLVYINGTPLPTDPYKLSTNTLGNKRYELVNHLGNVNAVITDRKEVNPAYSAVAHDFDFTSTGNTGWTISGCSGTTATLSSGRLRFTPGSGCAFNIYKDFAITATKPYNISFELDRSGINTFNVEIYNVSSGGTATLAATITNPANGWVNYTLTPTQAAVRIYLKKVSAENRSVYLDNLRIQTVASPYVAMVTMTSDYYPFGMQMPERHHDDPYYRYGYNGMEKDKEMHGEGNSYTTEFRQYDPRLGRWASLDPLMGNFPWMSPYVAFNDNPIYFTDPLGLEGDPVKPNAESKGLPSDPQVGTEYSGNDGRFYTYDEEGWSQSVGGSAEVIGTSKYAYGLNPDKYYSVGSSGKLIESGMMYNNSLRGSVWSLLLDVHFNGENKKSDQKLESKINSYHNFRKTLAHNKAVNEYNKSHNIIYLTYEISPFSAIPEIAGDLKHGNYASAIFAGAIEFVPGDDIIKSARRVLKTSKTGQQVLVGVQALTKKIDRGDAAYKHIKKSANIDIEVDNIIQSVMGHPEKVLQIGRDQSGREIIDIFNPDSNQGIRLDLKTGEFVTFVNYNP